MASWVKQWGWPTILANDATPGVHGELTLNHVWMSLVVAYDWLYDWLKLVKVGERSLQLSPVLLADQ